MRTVTYKTKGTCSREIVIELDEDTLVKAEFIGGCDGNTHGISSLVSGMNVHDVIKRLEGITCGLKKTSCPDQLAMALKEAITNN